MFPDLRGLVFTDDGNIIGRFSQDLKLITTSKSVFKLDGNLNFNLVKTLDAKTGLLTTQILDITLLNPLVTL